MKFKEIINLTDVELHKKLKELRKKLIKLKHDHILGKLKNPNQIKFVKKDIARILTLINQRKLKK